MKRNFFAVILLVAAVAFSCTSTEEPLHINDGSVVSNPTVTIESFVLDGPATKTAVTIDEVEGKALFTFTDNDVLSAYPYSPESGDGLTFTVKSKDASSATFTNPARCMLLSIPAVQTTLMLHGRLRFPWTTPHSHRQLPMNSTSVPSTTLQPTASSPQTELATSR